MDDGVFNAKTPESKILPASGGCGKIEKCLMCWVPGRQDLVDWLITDGLSGDAAAPEDSPAHLRQQRVEDTHVLEVWRAIGELDLRVVSVEVQHEHRAIRGAGRDSANRFHLLAGAVDGCWHWEGLVGGGTLHFAVLSMQGESLGRIRSTMNAPEAIQLLNDQQVQEFIEEGWLRLQADVDPSLHEHIDERLRYATEREYAMGNNIVARIPAIWQVLRAPTIHGALVSLLGNGYYVHPHRAVHTSTPLEDSGASVALSDDAPRMGAGSMAGSSWHQDAQSPLARARHHLPRYLIGFYYPHDTPPAMGPTRWQPGTHLNARPTRPEAVVQPDDIHAGTFLLLHFDLVHAGFPNFSDRTRYMLKFVFVRTELPTTPTWTHETTFPPPRRTSSRYIWQWLGAARTEAPVALAPALNDLDAEDQHVRLDAIYSAAQAGSVGALAEALRARAGEGLERRQLVVDEAGRAVPRDDVRDYPKRWNERAIVMEDATYALAAAGARAVPVLLDLLEESDPWVRLNAAFALGEIGPPAGCALPRLAALLDDSHQVVVRQVLDALGSLGVPLGVALPQMMRLLERNPPAWNVAEVRRGWTARDQVALNIAFALLNAINVEGEDLAAVETLLVQLLDGPNGYTGAVASEALTRLGTATASRAALRYLQERRWDESLYGGKLY